MAPKSMKQLREERIEKLERALADAEFRIKTLEQDIMYWWNERDALRTPLEQSREEPEDVAP